MPKSLSRLLSALTVAATLSGATACTAPPSDVSQIGAVDASAGSETSPTAAMERQNTLASTLPQNAHAIVLEGLMVGQIDLADHAGQAILLVNTASECGFTPQYEGLQKLHETRAGEGLVIIGVPSNDFGAQEPGGAAEIAAFCELNYGVGFPMAAKSEVTGPQAHPIYQLARAQLGDAAVPQWNFHKILFNRDGQAVAAFPSAVLPDSPSLGAAIDAALAD